MDYTACQVPQSMGFPSKNTGCCWSVTKLCPTLCNPMNCSAPDFPFLHYLPEFVQTRVHWISVPSNNHLILCHPHLHLPSIFPSIRVFSIESALHRSIAASASASVLPMNIQTWFPLGLTSWISLLSKGLPKVFSSNTLQKHQFFSAQSSLWSNFHIWT